VLILKEKHTQHFFFFTELVIRKMKLTDDI